MIPTIVIIGRRNVGKSALFNRLIEQDKAIISDIEGTTRDRTEGICIWQGRNIRIVDTGGLDIGDDTTINREIKKQASFAIKEADVVIFLVDTRVGPQASDRVLAKQLHHKKAQVILAANKSETPELREKAADPKWRGLKFGIPMAISALTGIGVGDLLDEIFTKIKFPTDEIDKKIDLKIAIIGKPNVGKSSLLNKILGEERVIVSPTPHTTREPQDTLISFRDKNILLVDTAGIRRKSLISRGVEKAGVSKTIKVINQADVVLFTLDITQGIDFQDKHLAGMIDEVGAGVVIVANKLDLMEERGSKQGDLVKKIINANLPGLTFAPIAFTSALTGHHVQQLLEMAFTVYENRCRIIPNKELKELLPKLILRHKPSKGRGSSKHPIIRRIEQIATRPPTFKITMGPKQSLHRSYLRYLENRLREIYDFQGSPLKIFAEQENTKAPDSK